MVVDLDGTLVRSNLLHEMWITMAFRHPLKLIANVLGRRAAPPVAPICCATLSFRPEVLALINAARAEGRSVHLVTAADQSVVEEIQRFLGCFDSVYGSDSKRSLRGPERLAWLRERFPDGFAYAGNNRADVPIWKAATVAILVGKGVAHAAQVRASGVEVKVIPDVASSDVRDLMSACRMHQWAKNLLIFVPLFLGHLAGDVEAVLRTVIAFFAFCLVASGSYLLNDLSDLDADRQHATKRRRALAAGRIQIAHAGLAATGLIVAGVTIGLMLSTAFIGVVAAYFLLTLSYSYGLKAKPILDVAAIGALFTLRVVMGIVLHPLTFSPWLLSFSLCFFFSMALAKRHVEVMRLNMDGGSKVLGRGYRSGDWPLTLCFGVATSVSSVVIMILFVKEQTAGSVAYASPAWLYVAPAMVTLWVMRIWLLSHRTELDDDPVAFALRDRISYLLGAVVLVGFILAI